MLFDVRPLFGILGYMGQKLPDGKKVLEMS